MNNMSKYVKNATFLRPEDFYVKINVYQLRNSNSGGNQKNTIKHHSKI